MQIILSNLSPKKRGVWRNEWLWKEKRTCKFGMHILIIYAHTAKRMYQREKKSAIHSERRLP